MTESETEIVAIIELGKKRQRKFVIQGTKQFSELGNKRQGNWKVCD